MRPSRDESNNAKAINCELKLGQPKAWFTGLVCLGLSGLGWSCSSARLNFQSNPAQAEVLISPLEGGAFKSLGRTPFSLNASEVQAVAGSSGPVVVEFRKDGYEKLRVVVTDVAPTDVTISGELPTSSGLEDVQKLNAVVDSLFEAQRLTRAGRLDDALKEVQFAQKEAPQISASYEIEGGLYYLQKKLPKALDAYQTAVKLNPRNAEAIKMRNYIQNALGLRKDDERSAQMTDPAAEKAVDRRSSKSISNAQEEP